MLCHLSAAGIPVPSGPSLLAAHPCLGLPVCIPVILPVCARSLLPTPVRPCLVQEAFARPSPKGNSRLGDRGTVTLRCVLLGLPSDLPSLAAQGLGQRAEMSGAQQAGPFLQGELGEWVFTHLAALASAWSNQSLAGPSHGSTARKIATLVSPLGAGGPVG